MKQAISSAFSLLDLGGKRYWVVPHHTTLLRVVPIQENSWMIFNCSSTSVLVFRLNDFWGLRAWNFYIWNIFKETLICFLLVTTPSFIFWNFYNQKQILRASFGTIGQILASDHSEIETGKRRDFDREKSNLIIIYCFWGTELIQIVFYSAGQAQNAAKWHIAVAVIRLAKVRIARVDNFIPENKAHVFGSAENSFWLVLPPKPPQVSLLWVIKLMD